MRRILADRRLLLKAGVGTMLGMAGHASFAEILEVSGSNDKPGPSNQWLLDAQSRLGENIIRYMARRGSGGKTDPNLIVSPASLASIFSFIDLGADAPMRKAIHTTLGFRSHARATGDLKALRSNVAALAQHGETNPLTLANLLVFDPSTKPRQMALMALSGAGADVLVDSLAKPKTIDRINEWVRQRTRDMIPSIIEEAPEELGLVAVNALYFKDKWKAPFDPARTTAQPFRTVSGHSTDVMMMHSSIRPIAFRQDDRFIAAELPYANENFKLVIVTTKSEPAPQAEFAAIANWIGGEGFEEKKGEISLPRLKLSAGQELLSSLDALGLRLARENPNSLDGFSPDSLMITRVVQRLELRMDEEGTEAAAATAVVTTRSIAIDDHVKMVVDKPFVFALRDQRTGLVVMMGYVGNPPKS